MPPASDKPRFVQNGVLISEFFETPVDATLRVPP